MENLVNRIADEVRDEMLEFAPRIPTEEEYQEIVERVARNNGRTVERYGSDIKGNRFVLLKSE